MLKVYTVSTNGVKSGELETRLGFAAQPADIRDNAMSQSNNEPTFIRINTLLTQEYGRKLVEYLIDEPIAENFVGSIEKGDITYKFTPQLVRDRKVESTVIYSGIFCARFMGRLKLWR